MSESSKSISTPHCLPPADYQLSFQEMPISLYRTLPGGQIVDVNRTLVEMMGYARREDLLGTNALTLYVNPEDRAEINRRLEAEGVVRAYDMQLRRPDGAIIWVRDSVRALRDKNGDIVCYEGSLIDITAQKHTEQQLQRQQQELESLLESAFNLSSVLSLPDLLTQMARRAMALLDADEMIFFEMQSDGKTLKPTIAQGKNAPFTMKFPLQVGQGLTGACVAENRPLLVNDAYNDPRGLHVPGTPEREEEHIMVTPLIFRERTIGAMLVNRKHGQPRFSEDDLRLFVGFAQQAAIAVENAQLYHKLESYTESLEQIVDERTRELRAAKNRLETIINSVGEGLVITDTHGMIQHVNRAFAEQTGFSSQDTRHQFWNKLLVLDPANGNHPLHGINSALEANQVWRGEVRIQRKDGTIYDAAATVAPIFTPDGVCSAYVGSLLDISARKEVERMKDTFVSNVSHELRTPLATMILNLSALLKYFDQLDQDKQRLQLEKIQGQAHVLNDLIEDILELSRLDAQQERAHKTRFDLAGICREIANAMDAAFQAKNLTVDVCGCEQGCLVWGDRDQLGRVFRNLLANAVKYTPEGGHIAVALACEGDEVRLAIADSGIGIAPKEQPHVFERFYRTEAAARMASGTGLGLAISREIVRLHGGTIMLHSVQDHGSTFTICLPRDNHHQS
ncbi:MAG: PAS domain S-box protein [Chloroflexi bacterium]|nr:PAS domain S-box protein [Chloroflexota bacterium]